MGLPEPEGRGERNEFRFWLTLSLLLPKLSSLSLRNVTYLIPKSFDNSLFVPEMELSSVLFHLFIASAMPSEGLGSDSSVPPSFLGCVLPWLQVSSFARWLTFIVISCRG
jgi:hypothetical protein